MATIRFEAKRKDANAANLNIRAIIQHGTNERTPVSLKFSVPAIKVGENYKHWDSKKQYVKGVADADKINSKIDTWKSLFKKYLHDLNVTNSPFEIQSIINILEKYDDAIKGAQATGKVASLTTDVAVKGKITFEQVGKLFVKTLTNKTKEDTPVKYLTVINQVVAYGKVKSKAYNRDCTPTVDDICRDFYDGFAAYLCNTEKNKNRTVNRKITRIRTIMKWANEQGYANNARYTEDFTLKTAQAARFALWDNEIETLEKLEIADPFRRCILDAFLFACYTTLRYSDIAQLKPFHFSEITIPGSDNKPRKVAVLDITQIKTTNENSIPLIDKAVAIWKRYKTKDFNAPIFKDLSYSQSANRVLKLIFKEAGLDRPCNVVHIKGNERSEVLRPLHRIITFHMSRNTAITNQLAKLSIEFVMNNAGIRSYKTAKGYARDDKEKRFLETINAYDKVG